MTIAASEESGRRHGACSVESIMKTAAAAPSFDLGSIKSAIDQLMASDAFASLKQHLGGMRAGAAPSAGSAAPGAGSSALSTVTGYVKANPLKSVALGIGAAALLSRLRGRVGSATLISALGLIGKQVLAAKR